MRYELPGLEGRVNAGTRQWHPGIFRVLENGVTGLDRDRTGQALPSWMHEISWSCRSPWLRLTPPEAAADLPHYPDFYVECQIIGNQTI
jgi:hypothetical protein